MTLSMGMEFVYFGNLEQQEYILNSVQSKTSLSQLPEVYTEVTPVIAPTKRPQISVASIKIQLDGIYFTRGLEDEVR